MNMRQLQNAISQRVGKIGFNRDHAAIFLRGLFYVIRQEIRKSPEHGEVRLPKFGHIRWTRAFYDNPLTTRKQHIRFSLRIPKKMRVGGEPSPRKMYDDAPWFIGEEARRSTGGQYGVSDSRRT